MAIMTIKTQTKSIFFSLPFQPIKKRTKIKGENFGKEQFTGNGAHVSIGVLVCFCTHLCPFVPSHHTSLMNHDHSCPSLGKAAVL